MQSISRHWYCRNLELCKARAALKHWQATGKTVWTCKRSLNYFVSPGEKKKKNLSGRFKNKSLFIKILQFTCTTGSTLFYASHNQRSFLHCLSQQHILLTNSQQWDTTQYKMRTLQCQAHPKIRQPCECRLKYAVRNSHQAQTRFQNTKCKSCQHNNH